MKRKDLKKKARRLKGGSTPPLAIAHAMSGALLTMNQTQFVAEVYQVASAANPDLDDSSSFQDVLKELTELKDKAMRWEILKSSFKPEPELFPVRQTLADARSRQASLKETQARQAAMRQGQL